MARSRKKTLISGMTMAVSEKVEKTKNHRRERRRVHEVLATQAEPDLLPHTRELSDPWTMVKDGKVFLGSFARPKDRRK